MSAKYDDQWIGNTEHPIYSLHFQNEFPPWALRSKKYYSSFIMQNTSGVTVLQNTTASPCPQKGGKFYRILPHKFITHRTGKIYFLISDGLYSNEKYSKNKRQQVFGCLCIYCAKLSLTKS